MPLNPDQVRVDILRIKRKLYISYPEGSKERQEFLLSSKLSELKHLQTLIAPDVMDVVFDEYHRQQRGELMNIGICLFGGLTLSIMLLGFHQLHPNNLWLKQFYIPMIAGLGYATTHIFHSMKHFQLMQPVKNEYKKIQSKIDKLLKEISELSK
jgi:hypothetical protein